MSTVTPAPATHTVGDIDKLEVYRSHKIVFFSSIISFAIVYDHYFVKMLEVTKDYAPSDRSIAPDSSRVAAMEHEISMMQAAGEDCAFQPLGRVRLNGTVVGFITHLGVCHPKTLSPYFSHQEALLGGSSFAFPSPKELIDDLVPLVHRLHGKGVFHGDIKPTNILYCKNTSRFLLCDFGSARLSNSTDSVGASTTQYDTPARASGVRHPLNKEDDLYATAITIWEIASSQECPFSDIDEDYIEEIVMAGFQPNIYLVEDAATRSLIRSLLDAGFPQASTFSPRMTCVEAQVVHAQCDARPPHTYMKVAHCLKCEREESCAQGSIYRAPSTLGHVENLLCQKCV